MCCVGPLLSAETEQDTEQERRRQGGERWEIRLEDLVKCPPRSVCSLQMLIRILALYGFLFVVSPVMKIAAAKLLWKCCLK